MFLNPTSCLGIRLPNYAPKMVKATTSSSLLGLILFCGEGQRHTSVSTLACEHLGDVIQSSIFIPHLTLLGTGGRVRV